MEFISAVLGPSGTPVGQSRGPLVAFLGRVEASRAVLRLDWGRPARQYYAFFHASTCQGARWRIPLIPPTRVAAGALDKERLSEGPDPGAFLPV